MRSTTSLAAAGGSASSSSEDVSRRHFFRFRSGGAADGACETGGAGGARSRVGAGGAVASNVTGGAGAGAHHRRWRHGAAAARSLRSFGGVQRRRRAQTWRPRQKAAAQAVPQGLVSCPNGGVRRLLVARRGALAQPHVRGGASNMGVERLQLQ